MGKPQHGQHVIIRLLHIATLEGPKERDTASLFVQRTISSNCPTLQSHDQWQWTYHPLYIPHWVNRWYSINLDTIFSHRSLHNGYRIAYTRWIGDLLLLLLLVLTCQISMATFTTRFYVIYYCGWWCRGSTLLQMQQQGQTAYKISQESWPAYGMRTNMDGELTEATDAVIRSSCMWIIGYHIQNPGNTIMYILFVVRLRIKPAVAPLIIDW